MEESTYITTFLTWSGWIIAVISFIYAIYTNRVNEKIQKDLLAKQQETINKQQAQPFELIGMLGIDTQNKVILPYDFQEKISSPYYVTN
ncbi:Uncharacterised protein [Actinobacillus equuli]|nr:Uncharacterised protein [Actinobacillus equuli]